MPKSLPSGQGNFLNASLIVIQNAKSRQKKFVEFFTNYTPEYFIALEKRVMDCFAMIGENPRIEQKEATAVQEILNKEACGQIHAVNTLIGVGYRKDPERGLFMKTSLSLTTYDNKAIQKNKTTLFDSLNTFKNTLPTFKAELISKGVGEKKLNELLATATKYINAITAQTGKKGTSTKLNDEQNAVLLGVSDEISDICAIAKVALKGTTDVELFNFRKILDSFKTPRGKKATVVADNSSSDNANTEQLAE